LNKIPPLFPTITAPKPSSRSAQLDLRKFVPHIYFAYITLGLAGVHVFLNAGKIWRYIRRKFKRVKSA
jgi:hypothetical protein